MPPFSFKTVSIAISAACLRGKENSPVEMQQKEVMIEGLLSIQAGENPRVIEEKLKSFLPPKDRTSADGEEEAGGEA